MSIFRVDEAQRRVRKIQEEKKGAVTATTTTKSKKGLVSPLELSPLEI